MMDRVLTGQASHADYEVARETYGCALAAFRTACALYATADITTVEFIQARVVQQAAGRAYASAECDEADRLDRLAAAAS